jgi:hypothetical protein
MTNANSFAVPTECTEPKTSRLTFSVKFLGMAPDEELLGLVRSFSARRGPSAVSIEWMPTRARFRARVQGSTEHAEHEDPKLALGAAFARLDPDYNLTPAMAS